MYTKRLLLLLLLTFFATLFNVVSASSPKSPQDATIGDGTAASCQTEAAATALSNAVLAGGTIDFNCGPDVVIINSNTNATDQTVIVNGGGKIVLSGENLRQLFYAYGTGNITLNDLTLEYGDFGTGGGVYVDAQAQVTINNGFFISNHATTFGGGIYNLGTLTINGTTFGSNSAGGYGGAIYNNGGTVTIQNAYFINNQSQFAGGIAQISGALTVKTSAFRSHTVPSFGGAMLVQGGTANLENVTFSNNQATQGGAIYKSGGSITMNNLTFNENRANTAAAIYNYGSATTVGNTLFTGSLDPTGTFPSLNCDGPPMVSLGRNIMSDNSCVPNPGSSGDLFATDPLLGGWQVPEHVYFPAPNSPAIDYGLACPAIDQLGKPRPFGPACDVGSVERYWLNYLPIIIK